MQEMAKSLLTWRQFGAPCFQAIVDGFSPRLTTQQHDCGTPRTALSYCVFRDTAMFYSLQPYRLTAGASSRPLEITKHTSGISRGRGRSAGLRAMKVLSQVRFSHQMVKGS